METADGQSESAFLTGSLLGAGNHFFEVVPALERLRQVVEFRACYLVLGQPGLDTLPKIF